MMHADDMSTALRKEICGLSEQRAKSLIMHCMKALGKEWQLCKSGYGRRQHIPYEPGSVYAMPGLRDSCDACLPIGFVDKQCWVKDSWFSFRDMLHDFLGTAVEVLDGDVRFSNPFFGCQSLDELNVMLDLVGWSAPKTTRLKKKRKNEKNG